MKYPAIEKFIETMGIKVDYVVERDFITSKGKRYACIGVHAFYKKQETYTQYHCYETTNTGIITYEEGNEVRGVGDSIFAYLGDDRDVDRYFEEKARNFAKNVFEN